MTGNHETNSENNDKKKSDSLVRLRVLILLALLFVTLWYGKSVLIDFVHNAETMIIEMEKKEEKVYKQKLIDGFIEGESISYTITNKMEVEEAFGLGTVLTIPYFSIRNNETKKVYQIKTTKEMYYKMASNQEFEAINSKDEQTMKIVETGEVFEIEPINY